MPKTLSAFSNLLLMLYVPLICLQCERHVVVRCCWINSGPTIEIILLGSIANLRTKTKTIKFIIGIESIHMLKMDILSNFWPTGLFI